MATIAKLSYGNYRVLVHFVQHKLRCVRRKGQYVSKTFKRKAGAYVWALEAERRFD